MEKTDYIQTAVRLEFASKKLNTADEINLITEAVGFAAHNLKIRHDITLEPPFVTDENTVVVYVKIPADVNDDFSYSRHLRGISAYILKTHRDQFKKYLIGNRLLIYTVIDREYIPKTKNQSELELYLIKKFINLISCSSIDELVQLEKILEKFKYMPIRR